MRFIFLLALLCTLPAYSVRVFLAGDSHVSAKVYPQTVGEILARERPGDEFSYYGKGSAGFYTYNETPAMLDTIVSFCPDVLVVHLGTNGSYSAFDAEKFGRDVELFYENIKSRLPECKIVLVTPFYNKRRATAKSAWEVNEKTRRCSDLLVTFAEGHEDVYVIDNNADMELTFVETPGLIREDYVHLTARGYKLLGESVCRRLLDLIAQKILKSGAAIFEGKSEVEEGAMRAL